MFAPTKEGNVVASLPLEYEDADYYAADRELVAGLSLGIALLGVELLGFLAGITMFKTSLSLISVTLHGAASVWTLAWFVHSWHTQMFWCMFVVTSLVPAALELLAILRALLTSTPQL